MIYSILKLLSSVAANFSHPFKTNLSQANGPERLNTVRKVFTHHPKTTTPFPTVSNAGNMLFNYHVIPNVLGRVRVYEGIQWPSSSYLHGVECCGDPFAFWWSPVFGKSLLEQVDFGELKLFELIIKFAFLSHSTMHS